MGSLNGHSLDDLEDDLAHIPDGDADDLRARAARLQRGIADLVTEAIRARDQHATMLDGLRREVLDLRRDLDRLMAAPAPLEHFDVMTGAEGWAAMKIGAAVSCPRGRGIVVEQHGTTTDPAFLVAWMRGDPWLVRREDFLQERVALVTGRSVG